MSEAKARATTRQLRRAMGVEAIGVVNNHAAELQAIHVRLGELTQNATTQANAITGLSRHAAARDRDAAIERLSQLTFGDRLRRLVTGR